MKKYTTVSFVVLAVSVGLALTPAVRAQDAAPPQKPPAANGMMGGDMQGMMKMMGQMHQMMENCNRMMQSKDDPQKNAPEKDRKG
jgi:hypothetical protein